MVYQCSCKEKLLYGGEGSGKKCPRGPTLSNDYARCTVCHALHIVFRDVFSTEQGDELADSFIVRIRAMLSRLPYQLPEETRLDMIYGLLHKRIRKRIPRDTVMTIESFIDKSRSVEESLIEGISPATESVSTTPQSHKASPIVFDEHAVDHAPTRSNMSRAAVRRSRLPALL